MWFAVGAICTLAIVEFAVPAVFVSGSREFAANVGRGSRWACSSRFSGYSVATLVENDTFASAALPGFIVAFDAMASTIGG